MNPRVSLYLSASENEPREQSITLARESHRLGDADRAMIVHLVRRLELPVVPLLQTWAELDAARAA